MIQALCALAIGGNLVSIVVVSHHGFQETTNIVVTSLAVCDLAYSLTNCLYAMRSVLGRFDTPLSSTFSSYYVVYVFPWNQWSLACSVGHVTIIALERMLAVCFPFRVSTIVTARRMTAAVISVYICNLLMSIPLHLIFDFEWVASGQNASYAALSENQFYSDNSELMNFFLSVVFSNLALTLPLVVVFVCTSTTIVKITVNRRHIQMSLTAASCRRRDQKAVKSLLTVCVVFLVVVAPSSVYNVYAAVGPDSSVLSGEFKILVALVQGLLYQTSATVNFFIYLRTSSKFAGTYKALFCFGYNL
ncbi:unnamed protein product [Lymnaea stagnalis]|uniref:G-protein coupled receptors family 1 profile domain-containing protein n=1 Tax=Lymnaea stagnalis TaxID=6523 RepID=A0AAV2H678_LYMST